MTPESAAYLAKAEEMLDRATALFDHGFPEEAGRAAYLAGLNAAQAFIFEKRTLVSKTHRGVQAEFARLAKDELVIDTDLRAFLGRTYNLKTIADYGNGPRAKVSKAEAWKAIAVGRRFVAAIAALIQS